MVKRCLLALLAAVALAVGSLVAPQTPSTPSDGTPPSIECGNKDCNWG
jgi:hypothetical protein